MSSEARPSGRRRRGWRRTGSVLVVLASLSMLALGVPPAQAASPELTVMTRNLSFGTDLGPILAATNQLDFVTAVAAAYTQAQATDFPGRAKAWAEEIDHARPDLVGLQEAVLGGPRRRPTSRRRRTRRQFRPTWSGCCSRSSGRAASGTRS